MRGTFFLAVTYWYACGRACWWLYTECYCCTGIGAVSLYLFIVWGATLAVVLHFLSAWFRVGDFWVVWAGG